MHTVQQVVGFDQRPGAGAMTVGFGTTVAMWAVGYVGRLPAVLLPSPILLGFLLATLFVGGIVLGRQTGIGWRQATLVGLQAGLLSGALNLLVLGSFLTGDRPNEVTPSALLWIPLSVLVSGGLVAAGAGVGSRYLPRASAFRDWPSAFVRVAIAATLLLLAVGGLVTSSDAGLAVVDWPNSFGYNMFLYPFARMTGPIYYEHAHRLFGALVGLTTLILALFLARSEPRRWVRNLGWAALALVILQGLLGGLRVTGGLTLSTSPGDMRPSLALAMAHGVLGQLFFATLVTLGVFTSRTWRRPPPPIERDGARVDRALGVVLAVLVVTQLVLGAAQRHFSELLLLHILTGVAIVAPLTVHAGFRAWGLNPGQPVLQRTGLTLVVAVGVQVLLGVAAFIVLQAVEAGTVSLTLEVTLATAHQWLGAMLLAMAVMLCCWNFRLLAPSDPS